MRQRPPWWRSRGKRRSRRTSRSHRGNREQRTGEANRRNGSAKERSRDCSESRADKRRRRSSRSSCRGNSWNDLSRRNCFRKQQNRRSFRSHWEKNSPDNNSCSNLCTIPPCRKEYPIYSDKSIPSSPGGRSCRNTHGTDLRKRNPRKKARRGKKTGKET